jgi:hypothetical protein
VKEGGGNRGRALLSRKNMEQDILAGNMVIGNCVQEMAEEIDEPYTEFAEEIDEPYTELTEEIDEPYTEFAEEIDEPYTEFAEEIDEPYTEFADGVTTGIHAWHYTSTHSITNVQRCVLASGSINLQSEDEQRVFSGNVTQGDNGGGALLSRNNMQQDILSGNIVIGYCVQEMVEEINETYTEFADGVTTGIHAWHYTSTHSITSVQQCVSASGSTRHQPEDEQFVFTGTVTQGDNGGGALLSRKNMQHDILAGNTVNRDCVQEMAEESDETDIEFADGVATGSHASNCNEAEIIDISDDSSDSSVVIISSDDSMVVACADEDEDM